MAEEAKTPQEENKTSEKIENSEAQTQTQEKPVAEPVKEEPQEKTQETEVKEEVKEEAKEEVSDDSKSVLDELLEVGKEKQADKQEETKTEVMDRIPNWERDLARVAVKEIDPANPSFDKTLETEVVKEYLYQWARTGGETGPSLKDVAVQIQTDRAKAQSNQVKEEKKSEATAKTSVIPGGSEQTISAEKEDELKKSAKYGNQDALIELLRLREEKSKR